MKVGDKVQIVDLSYSKSVNENGELVYPGRECYEAPAIVVAINWVLPALDHWDRKPNTIIVQICETKQLVFTREPFVEPLLEHTLSFDGDKPITITNKLYQELKEHFTS